MSIQVVYFQSKGRAEKIRLLLADVGAEWENVFIDVRVRAENAGPSVAFPADDARLAGSRRARSSWNSRRAANCSGGASPSCARTANPLSSPTQLSRTWPASLVRARSRAVVPIAGAVARTRELTSRPPTPGKYPADADAAYRADSIMGGIADFVGKLLPKLPAFGGSKVRSGAGSGGRDRRALTAPSGGVQGVH